MCGIAGILGCNYVNNMPYVFVEKVEEMLKLTKHRGPDESKTTTTPQAIVGANRLSIVDAVQGSQPMTSSCCSNITVALNGEIYNHLELRKKLKKEHIFSSDCDTEVIAHLFEEYGIEFIHHLNGMFAIFITNGFKSYLIRDRFGVKPLYYKLEGEYLLFASEMKALVNNYCELNIEETYDVFETQIGEETIFKGVYSIPPGSYLVWDSYLKTYCIKQYYTLSTTQTDISEIEAIDAFRELILDAVHIRTKTDIPYVSFVSGGLDSTAITLLSQPTSLFSSLVQSEYSDERPFVNTLERYASASVNWIEPNPKDFKDLFVPMVHSLDYPTTTLAAYSQYILSRTVSEHGYRIVLSGLGADEYLGGYVRHLLLVAGKETVATLPEHTNYKPLIRKVLSSAKTPAEKYYSLTNRGTKTSLKAFSIISKNFASGTSPLNAATLTDLAITLPPLLRTDDRLNMYFGVESRAPFMDYRLIEFAVALPDRLRINIQRDTIISKYILRKALKDVLPYNILNRKDKIGFPSPVMRWINKEYSYVLQRAYKLLVSVPEIARFFPYEYIFEKSEFNRKKWLVIQWAAWIGLYFYGWSIEETKNVLFNESQFTNKILTSIQPTERLYYF